MALILADRVRDTTTTTGTGTVTLSGTAPTGYQNFSVIGNGNTTYYTINAGSQWEVGIGTYSSTGPTLARTTVLKSSNANALVNFAAGVKDVFVTYPADEVVIQDGSTIQAGTAVLAVANGGTGVTTSTGTGSVVLSASPTLTTPNLGTPSAATLTNATGLPIVAGTTGTLSVARGGTGVTTSTGTGNVVLSTSPALTTPNLGTPSAATLTNATGLPIVAGTTGTLSVARGGTGQTSFTNGQLLIGNTTGNTLTPATLTAGSNISITNGTGSITIASTDQFTGTVTSVALSGGTTGLTVSGSPITTSGTITLAGTLAVANGGTGVTTSTGTGNVVLSTSPTLVTPTLGAASATSIAAGLGAVGTPSYTFTGDTNTGMWSPAADTLAFSEGGVEVMRIDSSGNVGIGTSSPANRLAVQNDTAPTFFDTTLDNTAFLICNRGAGNGNFGASLGFSRLDSAGRVNAAIAIKQTSADADQCGMSFFTHASASTGASLQESMTITHAGNVGIGTSSPASKLHANSATGNCLFTITSSDSSTAGIEFGDQSDANAGYIYYDNTSNFMSFRTNGAGEDMRITSGGNVGIGNTNPTTNLWVGSSGGGSGTATPDAICIGNTFANTAGDPAKMKLRLFDENGSNLYGFGVSANLMETHVPSGASMAWYTGGSERFRITSTGAITSADLADAVGYKGIPQNAQTATYTLALSDIGKHISITTGGVTIPANGTVAFPVGSAVTIYNNSASNQTISITTDTLRLAGTATTGSRTLAQRGICTCVKVAATEWVISGAGLT